MKERREENFGEEVKQGQRRKKEGNKEGDGKFRDMHKEKRNDGGKNMSTKERNSVKKVKNKMKPTYSVIGFLSCNCLSDLPLYRGAVKRTFKPRILLRELFDATLTTFFSVLSATICHNLCTSGSAITA